MNESKYVKYVVFVPESHADAVRTALGEAGAGEIGKYTFCSFTIKGVGRYKPGADANPTIGKPGQMESVEEERIEVLCRRELLSKVKDAVKAVHPYEEIAFDIYPVENE